MDRRYLAGRVAQAAFTVWAVVSLAFVLIRFLPGDPRTFLAAMAVGSGPGSPAVDTALEGSAYDPGTSILSQYVTYVSALLQGDFGQSLLNQEPVLDVILRTLPWTLFVIAVALSLTFALGISLGALMAYWEGTRFDVLTSYLAISHDLANARYFAGKADGYIGIMYLGEIVEFGPAEAVPQDPRHPYTRALRWATPNLGEPDSEDRPVRSLDIPDPVDPPAGCRFHTRCPVAREACREGAPAQVADDDPEHVAACFRAQPDHAYWASDPLPGVDEETLAAVDGGTTPPTGDAGEDPPTESE